jgi:hypothetical protein
MPGLFSGLIEDTTKHRLDQRLWGLFIELLQIITVIVDDLDEQELLEKIFQSEKIYQMINRILRDDPKRCNEAA